MRKEILKRAAYLMNSLPCRLPSGFDIAMTLDGYVMALEDCQLQDIDTALRECVRGEPTVYRWAPPAPQFRQLVKDAAARRISGDVKPTTSVLSTPIHAGNLITDAEYCRMMVKAEKAKKSLTGPKDHDDWIGDRIKSGEITKGKIDGNDIQGKSDTGTSGEAGEV